jgi:hypothetical protein
VSRSSRRATRIALLGFALMLVALFFATCEKREIELQTGYRGEAKRNPYLAAQRMLARMGGSVSSHADPGVLFELPSERGTIFLPTARSSVSPARSAELVGWAERGGHLVVVVWQLWDDENRTPDPILDPLGIRQFMNQAEAEDDDEQDEQEVEPGEEAPAGEAEPADDEPEARALEPVIASVRVRGRDDPLQARFDPRFRFELAPEAEPTRVFEIGDENGVHLVTVRVGQGFVTALTDDYFLTQPTIGELDHAELVYRLAHYGGRAGPIAFVYGDDYPGALELMWKHGWAAVLALGALVVAWAWSVSRRFGPIRAEPAAERRALMEHVRAAGRFQWRRGASGALVAATREALLARLRERHPRLEELSPAEQAARLAELAQLPAERVARALAFRTDTESSRFAQDVAVLEKIRRAL